MSIELLKKSLKEDKLVYGFQSTLKNIKNGKTTKVFLASNCPEKFKEEVKKYSSINVNELKEPNKELSLICKKKFAVNILSSVKK